MPRIRSRKSIPDSASGDPGNIRSLRTGTLDELVPLFSVSLGKLSEAGQLLREVIALRRGTGGKPRLAASLDHLALNLLQQGRYPEVGHLLDEALDETPKSNTDFRATLLLHRARFHHTLGSYAKLLDLLRQALAMDFENPELRFVIRSQMGLSQLRLGKYEEGYSDALAAAGEAKRLYSFRPFLAVPYINNLGAIALSQGDAVRPIWSSPRPSASSRTRSEPIILRLQAP